jgi:diguanylate cyclase (GGDEF)-like protein/PAS domain S-box-containing protein
MLNQNPCTPIDPKNARILLADDDARLLESLADLLRHHNYQVETALGGRNAIEKLSSQSYDLLLLDLKMPEYSGHDVMRFMAEHNIKTMTIVVSGETSLDDISLALRQGAYDYLKKPYVPEELTATVNNAVRKKLLENSNELMQARLDRSEKLHRFIVNNSSDIIFMLDKWGCFSFLNSKTSSLLGYDQDALIGKHISSLVEGPDAGKLNYLVERTIALKNDCQALELAIRPKDQSKERFFEISLWKIDNESGETHFGHDLRYCIYGTARDITERMEAQAYISFQAQHDLLTQLPNRALFKDRLSMAIAQAPRGNARPAVMFIDLDRFKVINDSLGHTMGDCLLQAVSQRFQQCVRKSDTLSRFGGDEFTLLLADAQSEQSATQVAEKILDSVKKPFNINGHEIFIGASIGVSIYPHAGTTLDELIKNADIAMYKVKNSGKDGFLVFNSDMKNPASERLSLEQDLRHALEHDEFEICYQPQIDIKSGTINGVEALIRWNHPTQGRLFPAQFIPIAEDCRLIAEMDSQTLRKGCRELKCFHETGMPELRLAVNLSPLLIEKDNFVDNILNILAEEQFPAALLELEITENILISDRQDIVDKLLRLTDAGVKLAIDDFGTGYSSLSYLQKFPINTLKIDRSFIHMIDNLEGEACLVNAIISMADGLKMDIVAEGVENKAQLNYLKNLGCTVVQGFLFGHATSLASIAEQFKQQLSFLQEPDFSLA